MLTLTSIILLTLALPPIQAPPPAHTADETAIRTIVADQADAWNAGDGKRYARHMSAEVPAGIVVPADGVVKTQLMEVFVRRDGRWWVDACHNVDVKPSSTAR